MLLKDVCLVVGGLLAVCMIVVYCVFVLLAIYSSFLHPTLICTLSTSTPPLLTPPSRYATPLSEIDFAQCRKCTPSYRALPKNYPKPLCSERTEAEAAVSGGDRRTHALTD